MRLHNPWVGYVQRTYNDIKQSILNRLRVSNPEITDLRETNILVIIVSIFAGVAEQLGYYTDKAARESFLSTAQKFSSVVKLVKILDYRIKSRLPSQVDLYFTYVDINGVAVTTEEPGTIPAGTVVSSSNGLTFITTETLVIPIGRASGKVAAKQWEEVGPVTIGWTNGVPDQEIQLPEDYAHGSLNIVIDGEPWENVRTLAYSLPTDKHYVVNVNEDMLPYLVFGNNTNGLIPVGGKEIIANYYATEGDLGNQVPPGEINTIESTLILPIPATQVIVRNTETPVAGSDIEDIDSIRHNAPLSTKTIERGVTLPDINYLAQQAPGVGKSSVVYNCGKSAEVYISPTNGGIANSSLVQDTQEYLNEVVLFTARVVVKAAGVTPIALSLSVTPRFRTDKGLLISEIKQELLNRFSVNNNQINGRIAISDIIAAVDNLAKVDYVDILNLATMPYAFPIDHDTQLDWARETLPTSKSTIEWQINYTVEGFRLWKGGLYLGVIPLDTQYTDPEGVISLRFNSTGIYEEGDTWKFTTYPANQTIRLTDNTVPTLLDSTIEITVNDI